MALPEIHSEVLFLGRATQLVVAQPQVLELRGWLSTQILQIIHIIVAELQHLPRTEGTTNTLEITCSWHPLELFIFPRVPTWEFLPRPARSPSECGAGGLRLLC